MALNLNTAGKQVKSQMQSSPWLGAASQIGSSLIGMIGQRRREKRAMANQRSLMQDQLRNQQILNEQGRDLQLDMWKKTNYPAQVKMLEEAGLSTSLMYGSGGGSGTTSGSQGGGSASGGNAPAPQQMLLPRAAQAATQIAQIELAKSQAEKNRAEAEKIKGVDTKEAETRIADLTQGIKNQKAQYRLTEAQEQFQKIENLITGETATATIEQAFSMADQAFYDMNIAKSQDEKERGTIESHIEQQKMYTLVAGLTILEKKANIEKTREETKAIAEQLKQKWTELGLNRRSLDQRDEDIKIHRFKEEVKAMYPSVSESMGYNLNQVIMGMKKMFGGWELDRKVNR